MPSHKSVCVRSADQNQRKQKVWLGAVWSTPKEPHVCLRSVLLFFCYSNPPLLAAIIKKKKKKKKKQMAPVAATGHVTCLSDGHQQVTGVCGMQCVHTCVHTSLCLHLPSLLSNELKACHSNLWFSLTLPLHFLTHFSQHSGCSGEETGTCMPVCGVRALPSTNCYNKRFRRGNQGHTSYSHPLFDLHQRTFDWPVSMPPFSWTEG